MHETNILWSCSPALVFVAFRITHFPACFAEVASPYSSCSRQGIWPGLAQRCHWGMFLLPVVLHKRALLVDSWTEISAPKHLSTWSCWFSRRNRVYRAQYACSRALRVHVCKERESLWDPNAKLRSTFYMGRLRSRNTLPYMRRLYRNTAGERSELLNFLKPSLKYGHTQRLLNPLFCIFCSHLVAIIFSSQLQRTFSRCEHLKKRISNF